MADTVNEAGREEGLAEQAQSKVQETTATAQEKASELREQGSQRLREQIDQRSTQAGSQVRSLGEALRRSGGDLQDEGNRSAAQLTNQVAERLERLGGYLEQASGDDVVRDVESFARRRPWMVAGIGVAVGLAAARFVKASSEQRYSDGRVSSETFYSTGGELESPQRRAEMSSLSSSE